MSDKERDYKQGLTHVLNTLAESTLDLSDEEVEAEIREEGDDPKEAADRVRNILRRAVKDHRQNLLREAQERYVEALDRGDTDAITAVLADASDDHELNRRIAEINLAYQDEGRLAPLSHDADVVRQLVHRHLTSAFEANDLFAQPVTVGEVASYLKEQRRVPFTDSEVNESLLSNGTPLPHWLSAQEVKKLAAELGADASARYWKVFRDTAITLCMGHSHQQAQHAARDRRARKRAKGPGPRQEGDGGKVT